MTVRQFINEGKDFFRILYSNRLLIIELTKREFKTSYAENIFGLLWAILEPVAMMTILWLVFSFMRSGGAVDGMPYSVFLLSGLLAYDFFNKGINRGARSIKSYNFLVKTVYFRIAVIPFIVISSELIIHLIVMGLMIIILMINHVYPSVYWLQVFYYMIAQYILLIGMSWLTGSILPFFPDIAYIITIFMRVLFFMTPIFWDMNTLPKSFVKYFYLNPLVYIVNGYRESFVTHVPFWQHGYQMLFFWICTLVALFLGIVVFKRLRPHFADVL